MQGKIELKVMKGLEDVTQALQISSGNLEHAHDAVASPKTASGEEGSKKKPDKKPSSKDPDSDGASDGDAAFDKEYKGKEVIFGYEEGPNYGYPEGYDLEVFHIR
jgi:hypothetical protein